MTANFSDPIYQDADAARQHLEKQRWPDGPECPHCGNIKQDRIKALAGKSHRPGLYQCAECREQFTVTVGTVFERSKIPLNKWLYAVHLLTASKKGISAHQIHRMLGITYKSAWFMCHRIREAMIQDTKTSGPLGGEGSVVEADETYLGKQDNPQPSPHRRGRPFRTKNGSGPAGKRPVVALVERGGSVRSFHVANADVKNVREIVLTNASRESVFYTDESRLYITMGKEFAEHDTVKHSVGEYVRGDVHTNTIESVFSVFKRGMRGVYQHCGEKHLQRYLTEFSFRHNTRTKLEYTDAMRRDVALSQIGGKRLTYRRVGESANA